jgi:hypothetical protein
MKLQSNETESYLYRFMNEKLCCDNKNKLLSDCD